MVQQGIAKNIWHVMMLLFVPAISVAVFVVVVVYLKLDWQRWLSVIAVSTGILTTATVTSRVRRKINKWRGSRSSPPIGLGPEEAEDRIGEVPSADR
jgi:putative effector of murein hydrolase LrgA (UPF0299 family)